MNLLENLRSKALFGGLDDKCLKRVICYLKEENFKKGELVIKQNEMGDKAYLIIKGDVKVVKYNPVSNTQEELARLTEGDSFGEMEVIDIQKRSASVKALTDLKTLSITNADLLKLSKEDLKAFSIVVLNIARIISRKLRKANDRAIGIAD